MEEDKEFGKNKSADIAPANLPSGKQPSSTHQNQINKKDQNYQEGF